MQKRVFSVAELNDYVRRLLAGDPVVSDITVTGEISGYKHHYASGHRYFSLKDPSAIVPCVMFKTDALHLDFVPTDGMNVTVHGRASMYTRDGKYQLYVDSMKQRGVGDLYQKFEELKKRLAMEGLFDNSRKKPLPLLPSCIGIVTSADGAALRDMVRISKRRNPGIEIIIAPCAVQGASAAKEICRSIELLNRDGRADVILCGRGGGSMEDLWCFNEEMVARAISSSKIPVISCVGHETDFTIADFVADLRAATPSMAAEIAVPVISVLRDDLNKMKTRIASALLQANRIRRANLQSVLRRHVFTEPLREIIDRRREMLDRTSMNLDSSVHRTVERSKGRLENVSVRLNALNPNSVMERGYACVSRDKHLITSGLDLHRDEKLQLIFKDSTIDVNTISEPLKR